MTESRQPLENQKPPLQSVRYGLAILLLCVLFNLAAGLYVTIDLHEDKSVLFLMALVAYPGPYVVFGLAGTLFASIYKSGMINVTFNIGAVILAIFCVIINSKAFGHSERLGAALNDSLLDSLFASMAISVVMLILMWLETRFLAAVEG